MTYTNYDFYRSEFQGTQIEGRDAFDSLAARASDYVDELTRWRARAYWEAHLSDDYLPKAVCAIAEILQQNERGNANASPGPGNIQSEVTSKHHITYASATDTGSAAGQDAVNAAIRDAAARYLTPSGLMYRGVGMC